eukprot:CAMPEP_0170565428 /NCGR_PEP_ID=MMETSP0211-20121228/78914_1 /TAXON_ID=311385 /ORGANISM="Pseudokeronopsis sp., Strain OXSARD2" /LENGTH=63 /DNA_ID=CAMNT_0010886261 /DNA_START=143 /DNA_END=331 /DNA_ORIENTATION=-
MVRMQVGVDPPIDHIEALVPSPSISLDFHRGNGGNYLLHLRGHVGEGGCHRDGVGGRDLLEMV